MRTLIVSDFHLGNQLEYDVLAYPAAQGRLLDSLDGLDRLVLLGDILELRHRRPEASMRRTEPVLRSIGERLPSHAQVVLVTGNHDLPLVRSFVRQDAGRLTLATRVPADSSTRLARIVRWLGGPERVDVRHPGVWLREDVYATHGHYLDEHLLPRAAVGINRGVFGGLPDAPATPASYERAERRRSGERREGELDADGMGLLKRVRQRVLNRQMAPLVRRALDQQMRRSALPALGHVAGRLGVRANWIVFGHVHRAGPLAGEDPAAWRAGPDGARLVNTGSWLFEPSLAAGARPPDGYWPGGAVVLEGDAPPQVVGLLDDLTEAELCRGRLP